ncbi:MAG TPA: hypothetical protein VKB74_04810 [Burkholderiales bacterium]|nr:hypothetical protein [Burkholderiales bacterium]
MNEGTGTYTRGLRNGAVANQRFYESGASSVDDLPKPSILRKITSILLALVLCGALLGYLTTFL